MNGDEPPAFLDHDFPPHARGTGRLRAIHGGRPTPRVRRPIPWLEIAVGLAAALLIIGLGIWNLNLQNTINKDRSALVYQKDLATALERHAQVTRLHGYRWADAALVRRVNRRPYLLVNDLPPIAADHVYELWLVAPGKTVAAAIFRPGGDHPGSIVLRRSVKGYWRVTMTVEQGPDGAKQPRSKVFMTASLSH